MSTKYEIVVVFNPDIEGDALGDELGKIEQCVKDSSGEVHSKEIWGRRQLAYPIRNRNYGNYVVVVASASGDFVPTLRRQLRLNQHVFRELIVIKDKYAPDLVIEKQEKKHIKKLKNVQDLSYQKEHTA